MKNEAVIRLGFFFGVLIVMAIWELLWPRRVLTMSKLTRWLSNLGIVLLDNALIRYMFPVLAIGLAATGQENNWGLLNNMQLPYWTSVALGVFALDLIIYLQHLMFHAVPLLWRLHMMHHADLDIDVTTGLRFHPLEIIISMLIKLSAIAFIGPSVLAVLIFEVTLNATAMFNHSNVKMPFTVDRLLRLLVVTPDMHRVHHSVTIRETNSNFGFNFPWWDRLFGTYRAQPAAGHEGMTIGLAQFRDPKKNNLLRMLVLPFVGDTGSYSIDRWGKEPVKRNQ
jgi:sterol desaturase/sphingolipid hydroxylase (fatty acid hydroxylase superfamily)